MACLAALADGTIDAIATDHAPHTVVDKDVEFGMAANGISGLETAISVVLAAVDAGHLTLARAIEALTIGPARVLGPRFVSMPPAIREGEPADLVAHRPVGDLAGQPGSAGVEGQEHAAARSGAPWPRPDDHRRRTGGLRGLRDISRSAPIGVPTIIRITQRPWRRSRTTFG